MEPSVYSPGKIQVNKKVRKILLFTGLGLLLAFIFLIIAPLATPYHVFGILLFLISIDIILLAGNSRRFYNWGLAFIIIILIAIFFRRMRWPLTGVLTTIGYFGLACFSFYSAVIFLLKFKHNTFLKNAGFASCVILSIVTVGLLWKNMHWPLGGYILNSGLVLFIPFLIAFVVTLPGSGYVKWSSMERIIFFRVIIIPMVFVYGICVLLVILPDLWTSITRSQMEPFLMSDFELFNLPGLF